MELAGRAPQPLGFLVVWGFFVVVGCLVFYIFYLYFGWLVFVTLVSWLSLLPPK